MIVYAVAIDNWLKLRIDDADAARRKYKKDLDFIKPDLAAYNKQKEMALGLAPGTLSKAGSSSSAITNFDPQAGSSASTLYITNVVSS